MSAIVSPLRRPFAILALLLAGALLVATAPTAGLAQDDDEPFQNIEQFEPVSISDDMIMELQSVAEEMDQMTLLMIYMQLQELGELETDITMDHFQKVDSIDDVNEHLGESLYVPDELPGSLDSEDAFYATGESGSASFTFDVEVAHRIARLLELPTDWLPDYRDQPEATISIDIPKSGMSGWKSSDERLFAGQIGIPEIDFPEGLDLDRLREVILDDPRLPDSLAEQLEAISDWESTLPVPVPEGAEYEDVTVQGNTGFQLTMDGQTAVVWLEDDTLHFVAGSFDADELQDIAMSISGPDVAEDQAAPLALRHSLYQ